MRIIDFNPAPSSRRGESPARVTPRQAEVLELRRRLPRKDVAIALGISENTVKTLQAKAIEALGAESLADAVILLLEAGAEAKAAPAFFRRAA